MAALIGTENMYRVQQKAKKYQLSNEVNQITILMQYIDLDYILYVLQY